MKNNQNKLDIKAENNNLREKLARRNRQIKALRKKIARPRNANNN